MEHLINFRKLSSSLTTKEFDVFRILNSSSFDGVFKVFEIMNKDQVIKMIFDMLVTAFQNAKSLSQINDVIIPNVLDMNKRIVKIIRSRNDKKTETKTELALERMPNENITNISSFLTTSQMSKFERCSRTMFIAVRSVPLPITNEISLPFLSDKPDKVFRWHRLNGARYIRFDDYYVPYLQLPFFHHLFLNLEGVTITDASRGILENMHDHIDLNGIELNSYQSILGGIKKLSISERALGAIGCDCFKSLRSLEVNCWRDEDDGFLGLDEDWVRFVIRQNTETLSNIEINMWPDVDPYGQSEQSVFETIRPMCDQCTEYSKWTSNVLKSVKIKFSDIQSFYVDELADLDSFCMYDLIKLLKQNDVSACFEFNFDWDGPRPWIMDDDDEDINTFDDEVAKLKNLFKSWNVLSEDSQRVCLGLNDSIIRMNTLN